MGFRDRLNKNFENTIMKMLKITILLAPDNRCGKIIYIFSIIVYEYMILPACCILQLISVVKEIPDIDKLIKKLSTCLLQLILLYKVTVWHIYKERVQTCVNLLNRKSFNFDDYEDFNIDLKKVHLLSHHFYCDDGQPELYFEKMEEFWKNNKILINENNQKNIRNSASITVVHKTLMKEGNIYSTGVVYFIYFMSIATLCLLYQDCIWKSTWEMYSGKFVGEHILPVNIYLPYDLNDTRVFMYASYAVTGISTMVTLQFIAIDLFFWSMLIRMTWQLKILCHAIQSIDTMQDVPYISKMDIQFCKCVNEVRHLICILDNLKYIYSTPLFFQYFFAVLVMCTIVYNIPQEDNFPILIGLICYVLTASFNLFLNFFFITMLTTQFAEIQNSLYFMNWVGTCLRFQKKVLYSILRMQKSIGFKMGSMVDVKLDLFIKALQTCYSVLTLIYNTKSNPTEKND